MNGLIKRLQEMDLDSLAQRAYENARKHGFHDGNKTVYHWLCLVICELYAPSEEGCCSKIPLPVWTDGVQCVSCWKCSFFDRLRILFSGRVWACIRSGSTQPPMWIASEYPFMENPKSNQE